MHRLAEQAQAEIGLSLRGVRDDIISQVELQGCCKKMAQSVVLMLAQRLGLDLALAAAGIGLAVDIVDKYPLDAYYTASLKWDSEVGDWVMNLAGGETVYEAEADDDEQF